MNNKIVRRLINLLALLFLHTIHLQAQSIEKPFIKFSPALKEINPVSTKQQFIVGSTCKSCALTINEDTVKVYKTGGFAYECNLLENENIFVIESSLKDKKIQQKVIFDLNIPLPPKAVSSFGIESIKVIPDENLWLLPGDKIKVIVKALPGCKVTVMNSCLYELPVSASNPLPGIYQGEYEFKITDTLSDVPLRIILTDSFGNLKSKETTTRYTLMNEGYPTVVLTKGRLAHLEYGWGEDRLGGAKIGYIDSLIPLNVIGKMGMDYKVRLAPSRTAFIPEEHVTVLPKGSIYPSVLTNKWKVYGDAVYDYINIGLTARLPYQSFQPTEPSGLVVDIFGATNNTNWISQLNTAKEIKNIQYEQIADEIFRVTIYLKHHQPWGHQIYYNGNNLVIKIKRPPAELSLKNLTIAVDAGHGGSNIGAAGPTGVAEKTLALELSLKIQKLLQQKGAKVIMTRETETFFDNKERILFYRDSLPDLLLSIHLNSSADPIRSKGTATFYRYEGYKPLAITIYNRLLQLGLSEYGCNGSFNFMLNSPTEYPNVLIETLFLSNPEEEMKILDEAFQQKMAEKIIEGVEDFLKESK